MHVNDATITLGCYSPPPLYKNLIPRFGSLLIFEEGFINFF